MKIRRAEVKPIIMDELALSKRCDELDPITHHEEMANIIKDIKATMKANGLKFLSAPAIGYDKRIFCIDDPNEPEIKTYVNPMPGPGDKNNPPKMSMAIETCSSFPGRKFLTFRQDKLDLYYTRPNGQPMHKEFHGLLAVKIQHELDHLEGIVISDINLEIDDDWDNLTDAEKDEIIKEHLGSLDAASETLNKEILADPEARELQEGIDFMTKVATGEVKLQPIK